MLPPLPRMAGNKGSGWVRNLSGKCAQVGMDVIPKFATLMATLCTMCRTQHNIERIVKCISLSISVPLYDRHQRVVLNGS